MGITDLRLRSGESEQNILLRFSTHYPLILPPILPRRCLRRLPRDGRTAVLPPRSARRSAAIVGRSWGSWLDAFYVFADPGLAFSIRGAGTGVGWVGAGLAIPPYKPRGRITSLKMILVFPTFFLCSSSCFLPLPI